MRETATGSETHDRPRRSGPHTTSRPPGPTQRLLSIQQVTIEYGWPINTTRDLVFRGALPRVRMPDGRRWWFDRRDIDKFVEAAKETGVV